VTACPASESGECRRTLRVFAHTQQNPGCNQSLASLFPCQIGVTWTPPPLAAGFSHDSANARPLHSDQRTTEDDMTNEENTADVRIRNWTLATGSKPGARDEGLFEARPSDTVGLAVASGYFSDALQRAQHHG
jgi:hypothetical protein